MIRIALTVTHGEALSLHPSEVVIENYEQQLVDRRGDCTVGDSASLGHTPR
jgi:hypothetical protein